MENIFDLALSDKEKDFINAAVKDNLNVAVNILEVFSNFPYIGSIVKLGMIGNKYLEIRFIKKVSKFLQRDAEIPMDKKENFFKKLTPKEHQKIQDYILHYLLHAEDDEKAEIMGYMYEAYVYGKIDNNLFLRLCSIIDKSFLGDLHELPNFVEKKNEKSIVANNFINLGLIDNYVGGVWRDRPSYQLNEVGKKFLEILRCNKWFEKEI